MLLQGFSELLCLLHLCRMHQLNGTERSAEHSSNFWLGLHFNSKKNEQNNINSNKDASDCTSATTERLGKLQHCYTQHVESSMHTTCARYITSLWSDSMKSITRCDQHINSQECAGYLIVTSFIAGLNAPSKTLSECHNNS